MKKHIFILYLLFLTAPFIGAVDPSYYEAIDATTGATLRDKLYKIASYGPQNMSYKKLWEAYSTTDVYPEDSVGKAGKIWDMYSNVLFTPGENQCGSYSNVGDCYNREHSLPKSWFSEATPAYYDLGHIVPTDGYVNNQRANYIFGECANGTRLVNGNYHGTGKLGASTFEGYTSVGTVFEPDDQYKGDFARMYMYMVVRYQKYNTEGISLAKSDGAKMFNTTDENYGFTDYSVALLMKWHRMDPVSQKEIDRNNGMEEVQGNRNPFIDYPYVAEFLWGEKDGERVELAHLMLSSDEDFIPGESDGWRENGGGEEAIDTIEETPAASKIFNNGQLYILVGEQMYTITGQKAR